MKAIVYHGPGDKCWEDVTDPEIVDDTDAIARVDAVTICSIDLHILEGDVPTVESSCCWWASRSWSACSEGAMAALGVCTVAGRCGKRL